MKLHEEKSLFDIILACSIMYSTATAAYIHNFDVGFALNSLALTFRRFYCVYVCVEDDTECMYYLVCIHFIKAQKKSNCSHTSWCGLNIFTQAFFCFSKAKWGCSAQFTAEKWNWFFLTFEPFL